MNKSKIKSNIKEMEMSVNTSKQYYINGTGNMEYIMSTIGNEFEILAIYEALLGNVLKSKQYFYKNVLAREWLFEEYSKGKYNIPKEDVTVFAYNSLYDAILSGSFDKAVYMAELIGKYEDPGSSYLEILVEKCIRYLILNDDDKLMECVITMESYKGKRGARSYIEGEAAAYRGVVERNIENFNNALKHMLDNHVGRMKKEGWGLKEKFAHNSMALAMIARNRGMDITIEHELLLMEYLEPVDLDYSLIKIFD